MIESGSIDAFEDRRFLGVGVFRERDNGPPVPLGLVRVIRSGQSRPFVNTDAEILQAICQSAVCLFEQAVENVEIGTTPFARGETIAKVISNIPDGWKQAQRAATSALNRVYSYPEFNPAWTRARAAAVLRDLLLSLRPYGAESAVLSTVTEHPRGGEQLDVYCFDSLIESDPPLPPQAEPVRHSEGALRWRARDSQVIVQFDNGDPLFTPVVPEQQSRAKSGFCVPFQMSFKGRPVEGVLAIDFAEPLSKCGGSVLAALADVVHQAARKLVCLSAGVRPGVHRHSSLSQVNLLASHFSWIHQDERRLIELLSVVALSFETRVSQKSLELMNSSWDNVCWQELPGKIPPSNALPADWFNQYVFQFHDSSIANLDEIYQTLVERDPEQAVANPNVGPPGRRAFGRAPFECADNIQLLRTLGVRLQLTADCARFILPLRYGLYVVGYCIGEFDSKALSIEAESRSLVEHDRSNALVRRRQALNVVAEALFAINHIWTLHAYCGSPGNRDELYQVTCESGTDDEGRPIWKATYSLSNGSLPPPTDPTGEAVTMTSK